MMREESPATDSDFKGRYIQKATCEVFGLKVVPVVDEECGHTHHLKNEYHYWSGTEKQFREQFEL